MFGVNKKVYNIVSLILGVSGIIILALKVFKVLKDKELFTLLSVVLMLLAFSLYLRPKTKIMKRTQEELMKSREGFYTDITKKKELITEVNLFVNEDYLLQANKFVFNDLSINDAIKIAYTLTKDYVMIIYGIMDEKKKKIIKSKVENFILYITLKDGTKKEIYIVKDYMYQI